jgi:hypothetical protein
MITFSKRANSDVRPRRSIRLRKRAFEPPVGTSPERPASGTHPTARPRICPTQSARHSRRIHPSPCPHPMPRFIGAYRWPRSSTRPTQLTPPWTSAPRRATRNDYNSLSTIRRSVTCFVNSSGITSAKRTWRSGWRCRISSASLTSPRVRAVRPSNDRHQNEVTL